MTAIPASTVAVRTMADGTLRLSVDIEPKDAKDAFNLFGAPGQPIALAALKDGYAAVKEPEPVKPGPLCREAIDLCANRAFWRWLESRGIVCGSEHEAKDNMLQGLGIASRKELDSDPARGARFINEIRTPFLRWQRERKQG